MDTMKLILSLVTAAVVGIGSIEKPTDKQSDETATVLVAEWPTAETVAEDVPTPEADPVPNMMAEVMKSYRPKTDSPSAADCSCNCDCPDEARMRVILREELATALKDKMQAFKTSTSNGSAGGATSNGSAGGTTSRIPTTKPPTSMAFNVSSPTTSITTHYEPVPAPTAKTLSYYRDYRASNGCTVRERTYSDGTTSRETISCPLQRRRGR